jgi:hypothetical protein
MDVDVGHLADVGHSTAASLAKWMAGQGVFSSELAMTAMDFANKLPEFRAADLQELVQAGIFLQTEDEFGDAAYFLSGRALAWKKEVAVDDLALDVHRPVDKVLVKRTRLELMVLAVKDDWRVGRGVMHAYRAGAPKLMSPSCLKMSRWYLVALLTHEEIFEAGVVEILQDLPEAYYRLLASCDEAKLLQLAALGDLSTLPNSHFKALLDGKTPGAIAIEGGDVDEDPSEPMWGRHPWSLQMFWGIW